MCLTVAAELMIGDEEKAQRKEIHFIKFVVVICKTSEYVVVCIKEQRNEVVNELFAILI